MTIAIDQNAINIIVPLRLLADDGKTPVEGLTYGSTGLLAAYQKPGDSAWTSISLVAGTLGTYTSRGFVEDADADGWYAIGLPDDARNPGSFTQLRFKTSGNGYRYGYLDFTAGLDPDTTFVVPRSVIDDYNLPEDEDIVYRGTRWTLSVDGISDLSESTVIYLGVKDGDVPDDQSVLQIKYTHTSETTEVVYVNKQTGVAAGVASGATITHEEYADGSATLHRFTAVIEGEVTALVVPTEKINANPAQPGLANITRRRGYLAGWKLVGDHDEIVKHGYLMVRPDINRATS